MNSLTELWNNVLNYINSAEKYTTATYNLWFKDLTLYKLTNTTAYIAVDSEFKSNILSARYMDDLKEATENVLGFPVEIALFICEEGHDAEKEFTRYISKKVDEIAESSDNITPPTEEKATGYTAEPEDEPESAPESRTPTPNPDYTFEKFIVGSTNKFAYTASMSVAENPATNYNPLYIYGQSGLGKTHLLYAIYNRVCSERPGYNALYVRGEDFANELIDNLSRKEPMNYFRDKYRKVDMILIDDIQFIAGKKACQEEFFHTFNALHEDRKQIILTSDLPPKEMKALEDRLRTRFEWGLIVDIQPPDMELRVAILKNKARSCGMEIPNNVLMFLADHVKNNIRQLEGAVRKLNAYSLLSDSPINLDTAKLLVSDIMSTEAPPTFATDKIFEMVCSRYGVSVEDVMSQKRNQDIVHARHIVLYYMRKLLDMTFPNIGKTMNMHHSTVMAAIEKLDGKMKEDPSFEMEITELGKDIKRAIDND